MTDSKYFMKILLLQPGPLTMNAPLSPQEYEFPLHVQRMNKPISSHLYFPQFCGGDVQNSSQ